MIKLTEENMKLIYLSNTDIMSGLYIPDHVAYLWENSILPYGNNEYVYLVSPKSMDEYNKFVKNFEKEYPLLVELR